MNLLHSLLMTRAGVRGVYTASPVLPDRASAEMLDAVMGAVTAEQAPDFAAWLCRHISESPLADELARLDPGSRYDLPSGDSPISSCMAHAGRLEKALTKADADLLEMAGSSAWPDQAAVCCLHALRRCR